jgi:hypothetical protein
MAAANSTTHATATFIHNAILAERKGAGSDAQICELTMEPFVAYWWPLLAARCSTMRRQMNGFRGQGTESR